MGDLITNENSAFRMCVCGHNTFYILNDYNKIICSCCGKEVKQ
jgi:hypothetical protein